MDQNRVLTDQRRVLTDHRPGANRPETGANGPETAITVTPGLLITGLLMAPGVSGTSSANGKEYRLTGVDGQMTEKVPRLSTADGEGSEVEYR